MRLYLICLLNLLTSTLSSQDAAQWTNINNRPMPAWFGNAKFGIFIHWGVYAVPSWATNSYADGFGSNYAEWYWQRLNTPTLKIHKEFVEFHEKTYGKNTSYADLVGQFKAELFNPQQWAEIFKKSGAKYVVLTSKHHDGFCLWPSQQSWNWNAVDVGPKRNLLKELSDAVKKESLKMGFYYSLYEWYNPLYKNNVSQYVHDRMIPQIKDLVTNYKPDILWTDGEWEQSSGTWKSKEMIEWLYTQSPVKDSILINDRWGNDAKGNLKNIIQTSEYGSGGIDKNTVWEETRGIGQSFGYNRNESLEQYATSEQLVHELIKVVSKGGNLLLNIGPTADGRIPVIMQQRLYDIGNWLKINGEAIYNTKGNLLNNKADSSWLYFTKNKALYAIATKWTNRIKVNSEEQPKKISLLGYNGEVNFTYKNKQLIITTPAVTPDKIPCQFAWVYKIEY